VVVSDGQQLSPRPSFVSSSSSGGGGEAGGQQHSDPLARDRERELLELSRTPMEHWSVAQVQKWLQLIGLVEAVVGPVQEVLAEERVNGHELSTLEAEYLSLILRESSKLDMEPEAGGGEDEDGGTLLDAAMRVGRGADERPLRTDVASVVELVMERREQQLEAEAEHAVALARRPPSQDVRVPKSWLRRWNSFEASGW
jgi:hypothetical protein